MTSGHAARAPGSDLEGPAGKNAVVQTLLREAGLQHLSSGFESLSLDKFRDLMIQDYEKYGVFDVEDKQALFKVVKDVDRYVPERQTFEQIDQAFEADTRLESKPATFEMESECRQNVMDDLLEDGHVLADGGVNLDLDEEPSFLDMEEEDGFNLMEDLIDNDAGCDLVDNVGGALAVVGEASSGVGGASTGKRLNPPSSQKLPSIQSIEMADDMPRIRVIVRKRPLNGKEEERGDIDVIHCDMKTSSLTVYEPRTKVDTTKYIETHDFKFDNVFDTDVDNDALYLQTVRPLISTVFSSGRATCFAYGQTGSGKTYTMEPLPLRAAADIFQVAETVPEFRKVTLHVSCYEIYGGKVFDLLGGRARLEVREDAKRRVQVVGLKEVQIKCIDDLSRLCQHAACARSTGSTGANDESSRSHSVMTFAVKRRQEVGNETLKMVDEARISRQVGVASSKAEKSTIVGKLSFIDLAGSERGADTYDNDKQTRLEGAEINKSLLALKECIRALDLEAGHVPFRGSKLTSVLRDSFVGKNARTVMIANVSPSSSSCEHTLNTLRYADRVKEMKKDEGRKKSSSRRESMVDFGGISGVVAGAGRQRCDSIAAKLMQSIEQKPERPERVQRVDNVTKIHAHRGQGQVTNNKENKNMVEMHRQHVEDIMGLLRREMDLLAKTSDPLSPVYITMDEYARELKSMLNQRLKAITSFQAALND